MKKSKALRDGTAVFKCFPKAVVNCMSHYIQATIDKKQSKKIDIHVATNNLSADKLPNTIVSKKSNKYQKEDMEIMVSETPERRDGLKEKGDVINDC